MLDPRLKRNLYPMVNWEIFLKEAKKEFNELYKIKLVKIYERKDFVFIKSLGTGSFGQVYLAKLRITGEKFAIKTMEKYKIVKAKYVDNIVEEKKVLQAINFPFCIQLEMTFQTPHFIYMCLPYLPGGSMLTNVWRVKKFDEHISKFYGAQLLLALEYLHYLNMIHRDVKLENVVMNGDGYVKLTDFGFCKVIRDRRTYTFCGTPEYTAPEIILYKGYGKSVDWWSFGVFIFEMTAGYSPFYAPNHLEIFEKVIEGNFIVPDFFSSELTDLVNNLIQVDVTKRYGNLKRGVDDIKEHPWFKSIDWGAIFNRSVPAPYIPPVVDPGELNSDIGYDLKSTGTNTINHYRKEFSDF